MVNTIHVVHYVAEGNRLIPAGESAFARDARFGCKSSNLKAWVEEDSEGRITAVAWFSVALWGSSAPNAPLKNNDWDALDEAEWGD